jgi:hypothetical protein
VAVRIRRSHQDHDFTILPNALLRDARLSYTARGVAAEILSRPDGWNASADQLSRQAARDRPGRHEGRRRLRDAFAELEAARYLVRRKERDPQTGRWTTDLWLYDTPQDDTARGTGTGTSGRPAQTDVSPGRPDVPLSGRREPVPLIEEPRRRTRRTLSPLRGSGPTPSQSLRDHDGSIYGGDAVSRSPA